MMREQAKRLLLCAILSVLHTVLWTTTANAQPEPEDRKLTICGQLLDADLKEPMVQATIQLFTASDSTFVGGTVSDKNGDFDLQAPSPGTYRLIISSIGYQTIDREVTLRRGGSQDLGNMLMETESVMLQEAVVTGRAAQVVVRKDTIMYNPEVYPNLEQELAQRPARRRNNAIFFISGCF